jgi:hypothetical protein
MVVMRASHLEMIWVWISVVGSLKYSGLGGGIGKWKMQLRVLVRTRYGENGFAPRRHVFWS